MNGGVVRQHTQCSTGSLMTHMVTEMRIDRGGCWEMQLTGLEKHAAHSIKRAEPTFSAPRAGLCNYLHQRIQPKYCTQNPELVPRKGGQREGHRPRHNQSEHQPITQQTCTLNMVPKQRNTKIREKGRQKREKDNMY